MKTTSIGDRDVKPENMLQTAIGRREHVFYKAIDRLRDLATDETENEVYDLTMQLKEALFLLACTRRLIDGRSVHEIHKAFGAPGDFGYETPIGSALDQLYRAAVPRANDAPSGPTCPGCGKAFPHDSREGADDDMPNHCDSCWGKVHRAKPTDKESRRADDKRGGA